MSSGGITLHLATSGSTNRFAHRWRRWSARTRCLLQQRRKPEDVLSTARFEGLQAPASALARPSAARLQREDSPLAAPSRQAPTRRLPIAGNVHERVRVWPLPPRPAPERRGRGRIGGSSRVRRGPTLTRPGEPQTGSPLPRPGGCSRRSSSRDCLAAGHS